MHDAQTIGEMLMMDSTTFKKRCLLQFLIVDRVIYVYNNDSMYMKQPAEAHEQNDKKEFLILVKNLPVNW